MAEERLPPQSAKVAKLDLQRMKLSEINLAKYNPRIDLGKDDDRYVAIERSLDHFGMVDPIIVNRHNNTLVSGHQRYKILVDKGYDAADVSFVNIKDEMEERALNLAMNRVSGNWDFAKLAEALPLLGEDLRALSGFEEDEIARLIGVSEKDAAKTGEITDQIESFSGVKCPRCDFEFELGKENGGD